MTEMWLEWLRRPHWLFSKPGVTQSWGPLKAESVCLVTKESLVWGWSQPPEAGCCLEIGGRGLKDCFGLMHPLWLVVGPLGYVVAICRPDGVDQGWR